MFNEVEIIMSLSCNCIKIELIGLNWSKRESDFVGINCNWLKLETIQHFFNLNLTFKD